MHNQHGFFSRFFRVVAALRIYFRLFPDAGVLGGAKPADNLRPAPVRERWASTFSATKALPQKPHALIFQIFRWPGGNRKAKSWAV